MVSTSPIDVLRVGFPLTFPIPTPLNSSDVATVRDAQREEDLLRNPLSFRSWWIAIQATNDSFNARIKTSKDEPGPSVLGPLAHPLARTALMRLTYLYESALVHFPGSFKLWKAYLRTRMNYVLGQQVVKKRAGGKKKFPDMKDALEEEKGDLEEWTSGLDPIIGWEEWKALVATFERALMWLPKLPRLWLMYLSIFSHPQCPTILSHTHARRTYDRALRTLPPSLHGRIWIRFLLWAESKGGAMMVAAYRRYLSFDPSVTEHYCSLLLISEEPERRRPLEAAKLCLALARRAARGVYTSPEGKSPYQLLGDWLDIVEKHAEEVGLDIEETEASNTALKDQPDLPNGNPFPNGPASPPYDEDENPSSPRRLNIEYIIRKDGLNVYKDQAGRLWTGLATYWIKRTEFDRAKATFEAGMIDVLTIRDFTQIFDAYAEFSESIINAYMESLANPDEEEDEEETAETERELDVKMKEFEELMDRRPFLLNDVLLRRNPNDVQEWEKRIAMWGEDDEKVAQTYTDALSTVNSRKATANLHRLYINFARFYEEGGVKGEAEGDLESARKVLEKAAKVNFKTVEDLAEVWCEWAEMEIRHENYDEAIRVMQRAIVIPKDNKINYHDHSLSVQARLFKSLKLWSFYVDLEESLGTVESAKAAYDKVLELKIANAQVIVNYAQFLEENKYFEESFKVYERGVELFTFPVSFEIWNIYLSKFTKQYGGTKLERTRDLFEQALEKCPPKSCKPIFLMYAKLEEDHGLAKRAMDVFDRATQSVADEDKFEMFTIYIAKAASNFGLPATRPIYQRAIEVLPDKQTAEMCLRFATMERKLGEIDRARAIYAHASQFCDPRVNANFWSEWNAFEIETGSEDTFREMLRIKRSVQAQFNTEASYIAAQMASTKDQVEQAEVGGGVDADPMAAMEREVGGEKKGPAFVAASSNPVKQKPLSEPEANAEEIQISDDEG